MAQGRNDGEKNEENPLHKSEDNKQTKTLKLFRGENPSPSQQRLLACVLQGDVKDKNRKRIHLGGEAAGHKGAGSGNGLREKNLNGSNADQEIVRGKWNNTDERLANDVNVDNRCVSDNTHRRNSLDDSLIMRKRKSESVVDINIESSDQNLWNEGEFKRNGKRQREKDKYITDKQTDCEACKRLLNDDEQNSVECTAL